MARWQLTEPHYLNVPQTKWELTTVNRSTGRPERKVFNVPLHLDPNIESDWNYREMIGQNVIDGKIIVCHEGKGEAKDIIFEGPPTPGMLPIDDEAKEISGRYSWTPTRGLDELSQADSFTQKLLVELSAQVQEAKSAPQIEGLADFMKTMAEMMKMQTQILAALTGKTLSKPEPEVAATEKIEIAGRVPTDKASVNSLAAAAKRSVEAEGQTVRRV